MTNHNALNVETTKPELHPSVIELIATTALQEARVMTLGDSDSAYQTLTKLTLSGVIRPNDDVIERLSLELPSNSSDI